MKTLKVIDILENQIKKEIIINEKNSTITIKVTSLIISFLWIGLGTVVHISNFPD